MYEGKLFFKTRPDDYIRDSYRGVVTKENGEIVAKTSFSYAREKSALAHAKKLKVVRNNIKP